MPQALARIHARGAGVAEERVAREWIAGDEHAADRPQVIRRIGEAGDGWSVARHGHDRQQ
jgi:hypothetical protein